MGWLILNVAFGIVALWLLGEVLLQYKARLRWRVLAFVGFLGVVTGVELRSIVIIGAGAIAFAVGQTQVTLSFRRGFSMGWALGGKPGASKRRKADPGRRPDAPEPRLEVSGLEYGQGYDPAYQQGWDSAYHQRQDPAYPQGPDPAHPPGRDIPHEQQGQDTVYVRGLNGSFAQGPGAAPDVDLHRTPETAFGSAPARPPAPPAYPPPGNHPQAMPVYAPEPMPDETGQYGVYGADTGYAPPSPAGAAYASAGAPQAPGYGPPDPGAAPADWGYLPGPSDTGGGYDAYANHDQQQYGYDTGQQRYPGYTDDSPAGYPLTDPAATSPLPGMAGVAAAGGAYDVPQPGQYDPYGRPYTYPPQDAHADPYGEPTPPGGVWMPQQRATQNPYDEEPPPEQQYPYPGQPGGYDPRGYGHGHDEQHHRY